LSPRRVNRRPRPRRTTPDRREDTARFRGVNAGTVAASEFFAPQNVARILGAAA
jgi:hypothetical protein